eukprot:13861776-Alexandrium_andersonii.AAC.1
MIRRLRQRGVRRRRRWRSLARRHEHACRRGLAWRHRQVQRRSGAGSGGWIMGAHCGPAAPSAGGRPGRRSGRLRGADPPARALELRTLRVAAA